tara:strand:+ start:292 stop:483 length:192 start_codon:yes stop_codon:yes gene_type:complete
VKTILSGKTHDFMDDFVLQKAHNNTYKPTCIEYITYKGVCVAKIALFYIQRKILCGQNQLQQK